MHKACTTHAPRICIGIYERLNSFVGGRAVFGPGEQGVERRAEGLAPVRQGVVDARRYLRVDAAAHQAVVLELAELLDQAELARTLRYRVEPLAVGADGGDTVVRERVSGDFSGSPVELRYRFSLRDGRIAALEIAP